MLTTLRALFRRSPGESADPASRAADALEAAARARAAGNTADAVRELKRAAEIAPDDADLLRQCGRVLAEAGLAADAEACLRRALALDAHDPAAMSDLAAMLLERGESEPACDLLERALAADPAFAPALINRGLVHLRAGSFRDALGCFERALDAAGASQPALGYAGKAALGLQEFAQAQRFYSDALAAGDDPECALGLAKALSGQGRDAEALAGLRTSLARHPDHLGTLRLAGVLSLKHRATEEAVAWLERAANLAPDDAALQSNLGLAYTSAGRIDDAVDALMLALHYDPELPAAHVNLGLACAEARKWPEAAGHFEQALARAPQSAQAAAGLAKALHQLYRLEEAEAQFRRALELAPESPELWTRLGQVRRDLGDYDSARTAYERALQIDPGYLSALTQLGIVALDQSDAARAIECFDRVVASGSGLDVEGRWNITCARLTLGDWERAWQHYDLRWNSPDAVVRPFKFREWDGADLTGKNLLVYAEQGLGDEIMFASCYHELLPRVGHLVIECSPKLEKLFRRSFPQASVFGAAQDASPDWLGEAPHIDAQAAAGTVASLLRRSATSFPRHSGYLRADPARVVHWRERLATLGPGPKVGISWRGGSRRTRTRLRSIELSDWTPIFGVPSAHFVSLQYHRDAAEEAAAFSRAQGVPIHHWQEAIDDYDETAALVAALDVVVTVCTAVVHLGGALGARVLVMVPASPEWRYQHSGERMPWYPSVELFRQRQPNEWDSVVRQVAARLGS